MLDPDFHDILSSFAAEGVDYLVVGAYAVAAHGLPRATGDIDLWIRPTRENAQRVWRALASYGAPLDAVRVDDFATEDNVFQIGVVPHRVDILTSIEGVSFDEAWRERLTLRLGDLDVLVLGRRQLIANKRAVGRPQDLSDVARLERGETRRD